MKCRQCFQCQRRQPMTNQPAGLSGRVPSMLWCRRCGGRVAKPKKAIGLAKQAA